MQVLPLPKSMATSCMCECVCVESVNYAVSLVFISTLTFTFSQWFEIDEICVCATHVQLSSRRVEDYIHILYTHICSVSIVQKTFRKSFGMRQSAGVFVFSSASQTFIHSFSSFVHRYTNDNLIFILNLNSTERRPLSGQRHITVCSANFLLQLFVATKHVFGIDWK